MKKNVISIFMLWCAALAIWSCTESDDGPISIYPDSMNGASEGFVWRALLDSGQTVHLRRDTLRVTLDSIWSLTNCFLEKLKLKAALEDTVLMLTPHVSIEIHAEDCAAPLYRPDTILYVLTENLPSQIREIRVQNTYGEIRDSIALRNGTLNFDTSVVYIDTTFNDPHALPRKTPGMPSVLRVLDSLTERLFYYRLMPSKCRYIIDTCETKNDTIFPSSWSLRDTNLVPIRKTCVDTTLRYCLTRDWKNDSTNLEEVKIRPDTLWYASYYWVRSIPKCGGLNQTFYPNAVPGYKFKVIEEIFTPASESDCLTDVNLEKIVVPIGETESLDSENWADSILNIFDTAAVGRDTL